MFQTEQQAEKNREVWAVEKWKSKTRIPTFPPPRQPAAARRKTVYGRTPWAVFGVEGGDISKEAWRRRSAPHVGQGVIVVDREK